jgi:hypothetical protein
MMTANSLNTKKIMSCKKYEKDVLGMVRRLVGLTVQKLVDFRRRSCRLHLCTLFMEKIADIFESQPVFKNSTGEKYQK